MLSAAGKLRLRGKANDSRHVGVREAGNVRHDRLRFVRGECRLYCRFVAELVDSDRDIRGAGVAGKERGGAFESMSPPAFERQRQMNVDIVVAVEE